MVLCSVWNSGAEHWVFIASLIENSVGLADAYPLAYLTDALTRIVNGHPVGNIDRAASAHYYCVHGPCQSRGLRTTLMMRRWFSTLLPGR